MRLRQDYLKESPGQYAHGECYRKHFFVPHKFTVWGGQSECLAVWTVWLIMVSSLVSDEYLLLSVHMSNCLVSGGSSFLFLASNKADNYYNN